MGKNGFARIISADSHVMEPRDLWQRTIGNQYGDHTPRIIREHNGRQGTFFYTGRQVLKITESDLSAQKIGFQEAGYKPEIRVEFQKQAGVEREILNATLMLLIMQGRQLNVVRAAARVFNDWLAEFCSHAPDRLVGVAMIPMDDPDWATEELARVRRKGLRGAIIHLIPPEGCAPLRDPIYDRFWACAQDLDVPITLHIITGRVPDPLHFHTKEEQGESPGTQIALMYEVMGVLANEFIFGGILDRFEKLKLICSEFEISWIPSFMWRIDQMQEDFGVRLQLPKLRMKASEYMRTRIWHGIIDDPFGAEAIPHIGVDRVLWGSDFPHVRSIGLDAESRLGNLFATLSKADRDKVVCGNVAALYGF
jgi:predicted TIM-barrel fold metal-dependent hydrolase